ncbi:hypothetical protein HY633_00960 [Candidatus Uhrbacteria bacterium]|nr:hypothetical protein [Candidatus Uhrbacteria bacterium]
MRFSRRFKNAVRREILAGIMETVELREKDRKMRRINAYGDSLLPPLLPFDFLSLERALETGRSGAIPVAPEIRLN